MKKSLMEELPIQQAIRDIEKFMSNGMLEDDRSVVFDQAENRLHAQKAILAKLFSGS